MNQLKIFLVALLVPLSGALHAQCTQEPSSDSLYNAQHPWSGDNAYLIGHLKKHGYDVPGDYFDSLDAKGKYRGKKVKLKHYKKNKSKNTGGRALAMLQEVYVPFRVVIHQNQDGNMPVGFNLADLEAALTNVNNVFFENDVPITLYRAQAIQVVNNSPYFNCVNDGAAELAQDIDLALNFSQSNMLNIHVVNEIENAGGSALIGIPSIGLIIPALNLAPVNRNTLTHELGHALGLLHTHNGSGIFCEDNEDCGNCEQECVDRYRTNDWICGQLGRKCAVNGDKLCDTAAEPMLNVAGLINACNYVGTGRDNWGDRWQVPELNIMSVGGIVAGCRDFLSMGQAAVMHWHATNGYWVVGGAANFSVNLAETAAGALTGPYMVCPSTAYSFVLNSNSNATNHTYVLTDLDHNVLNAVTFFGGSINGVSMVSNGTFTGPAYLRVDMGNNDGYITSLHHEVYLGAPQITGGSVTGPSEMTVGQSKTFTAPEMEGATSYQWQVSAGLSITSTSTSGSALIKATSTGTNKMVHVRGLNPCGVTLYRYNYVDVVSSGGGSGGGGDDCTAIEPDVFPNPAKNGQSITYRIELPGDGGGGPCPKVNPGDTEVEVMDLSGKKYRTQIVTETTGTINADELSAGIYLLNFKYRGHLMGTRRLIILD